MRSGASRRTRQTWINKYTKDSPEVKQLREQNSDLLEFYRWLEWIAVEQMHAAQQAARQAGMKIGIMSDMAVGVHPDGSEVWWNPERFANGATVGAPPDMFNQQGQNWSQPPLSPLSLKETGYKAYREMVRGMFDCAGAVRIDHILGLFRCGGSRRASRPRMAPTCTTTTTRCWAFSQSKQTVLVV